ncbi:MAG: type I secretion system permease/ATPase [Rickettsiales bacterium]
MNNKTILQEALWSCRKSFIYAFIFSLFINITMLAMPIYSLQVLDRVLSSFSIETLIVISLIVIILLLFMTALQIVRNFVFAQIGFHLEKKLEPFLIDKTLDISVHNHSIGSSLVRDLNVIRNFLNSPTLSSLFDAPFAPIYFLVIFFIHPINGIITVIGAVILFFMAYLNEKLANKRIKQVNDMQTVFFTKTSNLTNSSEAIIAMGMKSNIIKKLFVERNKMQDFSYQANAAGFYISSITKLIRMLIQVITMAVGAILVIQNKMSAGGIIATSILAGKALAPFDALVNIWQQFLNSKKSYNSLNNALDNITFESDKTELPEPKGIIKLENVSYKAEDTNKLILKSINFEAYPGEIIAIIGPSGGGKTTLSRLMCGIIEPSVGRVLIDDAKLQNYNRESLGKYIGYLPQQVEFIAGTIKENIARMASQIDDIKVVKAAMAAGSHKVISDFDKGYDTSLENLGKNLSAGQKQRIALARALYDNTKIMILDEPNSNLDSDGERALVYALKVAKQRKITTCVVSHRTAILDVVDKILVMHEGQIQFFDEKHKVLAQLELLKKKHNTSKK